MTLPIQWVAIDLDGTLLNSRHELTPRVERTLREALARGVQIILATGKTRQSAIGIIERLKLTTPGVYLQGLAIYNGDGTIRHQRLLEPAIAQKVIAYAETNNASLIVYGAGRVMARERTPHTDLLLQYHEASPEMVGPLHNLLDTIQFNKLHFFCESERIGALRSDLSALLNGTATLVQPTYDILEVLPLGGSKGDGLKWLLQDMKIDPAQVMAIGDGENDIEMLQAARIGVAMANAMPKLKEFADHITTSNDADGVAVAIERFVFNAEPLPTRNR